MSIFRKRCPYCSKPLSVRELVFAQQHALVCPDCGARMSLGHWSMRLIASMTGSLFYAIPIFLGVQDHRWWFVAIVGMVLAGYWNYAFLSPRRARRA